MNFTKTDYILRSLSKIKHKPWELYVISRIIHRSDDLDIQFVCQQLVRVRGGYRFLDMYFPQLGFYLEVDEGHHKPVVQILNDGQRRLEIVDATNLNERRIRVFDNRDDQSPLTRDVGEIHTEIEKFISFVRQRKSEEEARGRFSPWDIEKQFSPRPHIKRGRISLDQGGASFRNHRDALLCFGYNGGHFQRAVWNLPYSDDTCVWFPKLYQNKDWNNSISDDGDTITEEHRLQNSDALYRAAKVRKKRVVFAHEKDTLGLTMYNFKGVFERVDGAWQDVGAHTYNRISCSVDLPELDVST